ncbi:MAG: hypothetical protein GY789_03905 [Hyphomicrobiales bacterium]|nr:hypothetical protein [Hyphomicrobiales bacterium]MCP4998404.1 hypothetical protein [Hyphomicrobiales bacterium]
MFADTTEFFTSMLRITLVSMLFIAPVAGFAASHVGSERAALKGAGFVLFVSLQRYR